MKGFLEKKDDIWQVKWSDTNSINGPEWVWTPLHPSDVDEIKEQSLIFDNIESRIASYPEVNFEIVTNALVKDGKLAGSVWYAKLMTKSDMAEYIIP